MKEEADQYNTPVVLLENGVIGIVRSLGAHVSVVAYQEGGVEYEVYIPNEDFEIIGYIALSHEEE